MDKETNRWETEAQNKNIAWVLPRPRPDYYKGSMPLYAEEWLLDLARALLGKDKVDILSLFCGKLSQGLRVDISPSVNPDIVADAHEISKVISDKFDVVFADPPYSNEEANDLYGTPKLNYKKWTAEADKLLKPGGLLIVYHKYMMPNPNPKNYIVSKRVFIGTRTYHVPRVAIYFRKKAQEEEDGYADETTRR